MAIERHFNAFAAFLSRPRGFIATMSTVFLGLGIGYATGFDDTYMMAFNIYLSALSIAITGFILVSARVDAIALHVKLDHLIEVSEAENDVIGLEHEDAATAEAHLKAIEDRARGP